MPLLAQNARFKHGTIVENCYADMNAILEDIDMMPGVTMPGTLDTVPDAPGSRCGGGRVGFDLRGQEASGTPVQIDDILKAMGFVRTGSTGYTYTLGDYHVAASDSLSAATGLSPNGDVIPLGNADLFVDGASWGLGQTIAAGTFTFGYGQKPRLDVDLLSIILGTDAAITSSKSIEQARSVPSATATVASAAPWVGATLTLGAVAQQGVQQIVARVANDLAKNPSAGGPYGYGCPFVGGRNVGYSWYYQKLNEATNAIEDALQTNSSLAMAWTYVAGGATFRTFAFTATAKPQRIVRDVYRGALMYRVDFKQDNTTGPLTIVIT